MTSQLKRYIPTAAAFGGCLLGILSILGDLLGSSGSGTGLILAITIVYQYFEQVAKEKERGGMEGFML